MLPSALYTRITTDILMFTIKNFTKFKSLLVLNSPGSVLAHSLGMLEPTFPSLTFPRTLSWLVLLKLSNHRPGTAFLANDIACLSETAHVMPVAVDTDGSIKNSHRSHIAGPRLVVGASGELCSCEYLVMPISWFH